MKKCPYCGKECKNSGLKIHIAKAHPEVSKADHQQPVEPIPIVESVTDTLPKEDNEDKAISKTETAKEQKSTESIFSKITQRSAKLNNSKKIILQKAPEAVKQLQKRPPMDKDPEGLISMLLSIPTWLLVLGIPLLVFLNYEGINAFMDSNPIGSLLIYVLQHPGETVSIMVLVMFSAMLIVIGIVFYKMFWRMAFKDFQIKYASPRFMAHGDTEDDSTIIASGARRVFIPATYEGRVYASIGFGFWDRMYRKWFNVEPPENVILFVHRTWKPVNPFKPLSSCDKIYLNDPERNRIYKDGRFRTTTIATRMVRMSEDNSVIYWLDTDGYSTDRFNADWYTRTHSSMLDNGLKKVSKGCLVNPDIQQEQMRRNMLWLQPQDIYAEEKLIELKKKKELIR